MNMSPACLPPVQPSTTKADEQHPRFREYVAYRAAMRRQMVTGATFACWLEQTERAEANPADDDYDPLDDDEVFFVPGRGLVGSSRL